MVLASWEISDTVEFTAQRRVILRRCDIPQSIYFERGEGGRPTGKRGARDDYYGIKVSGDLDIRVLGY